MFAALLTISAIAITPRVEAMETIRVLVAYDEEWAALAPIIYGYTPEELAYVFVFYTETYFIEEFDIWFSIDDYVFWDSDDNPNGAYAMLNEAVDESGFESTTCQGLFAFTGQDIPGVYGLTNMSLIACLIEHYYDQVAEKQYTDHILQHEASHFWWVEDHYTGEDIMCIMAYEHWQDTHEWCQTCKDKILENYNQWAPPGGGGGDGDPRWKKAGGNEYEQI